MSEHPPCDPPVIADKAYASRPLTGTGKYTDFEQPRTATQACTAVEAGREVLPAGHIPRKRNATASSPIDGLIA